MMNYSNYLYIAIRAAIDAGKAIMDILQILHLILKLNAKLIILR